MASQKPSIPKGTRDFSPEIMVKRNYIFDTIRSVYARYGYMPLETPAMETLQTLLGKYGEEGDKLLFKVLNSGDFMRKIPQEVLQEKNSIALSTQLSEKGLRYDLTVPLARYVVQYRNEITFPFKRYQIQPVWRADRPQKGRYREFYQCDADVVGSDSLLNEVELIQIIGEVFGRLNIPVTVKLNNRKILSGIAEVIGQAEKIIDITVAIDKLDKIGLENVNKELAVKGIPEDAIATLQPIILLEGENYAKLETLKKILMDSGTGMKGIEETEKIFTYLETLKSEVNTELDLTLARGLNYYTGAIIEVKANNVSMGSICGGGRYDNLTGIFGMPDTSGVGISFGADRIYDVMDEAGLFPDLRGVSTQLLFINFGEKEEAYCLPLLSKAREAGINSEIYPSSAKMKKQMTYANNKQIPFVILAGEDEINSSQVTLKDMVSGEQSTVPFVDAVNIIKGKE
ncbi:MAG: histidine--tRNA ligase [Marinilabiliales bacterium]|nr:MAG: histidine--tRNA ligase [Marinilabiliales bacterium]